MLHEAILSLSSFDAMIFFFPLIYQYLHKKEERKATRSALQLSKNGEL